METFNNANPDSKSMKKRVKNLLAILGLCLLFTSSSFAQEVPKYTLEDAIKYALENSNSVKNAHINIADAQQQIYERRAFGLPRLSAGVDLQHFVQVPKTLVPAQFVDPNAPEGEFEELQFGTKNNVTAKLDASAMIFDGSYFTGLKAAKAYKQYVQKELLQKEQDTRNLVTEAYLPALILEETQKTITKNIENISTLLTETKALYKEGFVEQLDVDRLELSIANLKTQRATLERQKNLAYNVLKFQMNFPVMDEIETVDDIDALLLPVSEDDLTGAIAYETRPEYSVLKFAGQLNQLNIDLQKNGYLPSLGAFGSYQHSFQGNKLFKDNNYIPTLVVGLQLNVPIFDGFEKRSKVNRAKLDLDLHNNRIKDFERGMTLEVANARNAYMDGKEKLANQQVNLTLAERIYNTSKIKYKEGVGSSIEIVQAEQSLFTTQQNIIQAKFELLQAKIQLDKALGKK